MNKKNKKYVPINFYELPDVKKLCVKYKNPNQQYHNLDLMFNMIIIGSTGSGKTNTLMNIINCFKNTFNHLYIFTQIREILYTYLENTLNPDVFTINYGYENFTKFDKKNYYAQSLIIFDDFVAIKDQSAISNHFTHSRKISRNEKGGCSSIYISQLFFGIPTTIRAQSNYIILVKVASTRDLIRIFSEYGGSDKQKFINMYNYCCKNDFGNFLLIDIKAPPHKKYRKNIDEYLNIEDF